MMSIQMKALSSLLRFQTYRRGDTAASVRAYINRTKVAATPPADLRESHIVTQRLIAGRSRGRQ